jgi:hypothetical protein
MRVMRLVVAFGAIAAIAGSLLQGSAATAASWESRQVTVGERESDALFGLSCPGASLCVAGGSHGTIVTSENPGGGAAAWRVQKLAPGDYVRNEPGNPDRNSPGVVEAVSCPTPGMCGAVTVVGDFYATGDPAGGASTWRATDLDPPGSYMFLQGVSCPSPSLCVAVSSRSLGLQGVDAGASLVSIDNPLAASPTWERAQVDQSLDLEAVSCPSVDLCVAVGRQGRALASTNPGAPMPTWKEIAMPAPGDLDSVECPVAALCLAGNARGNVLSSTDPGAAAPSWGTANTGPSVPISGISCPTTTRCLAVTNNGDVAVSSDPTGPAGSWSATNLIPHRAIGEQGRPFNAFFAASCPGVSFCATVGSRGLIFTSRNPFDVDQPTSGGGSPRGPKRPRMRILRSDRFIRESLTRGAGARVTFRLRPFGRVRGFLCRLDRKKFRPCRSPLRVFAKLGHHVLRARAVGLTGLRGPVAKARFAIRAAG